jgi:acetyl-CoA synthetase
MIPKSVLPLSFGLGFIHSVVFAGFSASAVANQNDSDCKWSSSDGGYRGNKTIDLKGIIDDALVNTLVLLTY